MDAKLSATWSPTLAGWHSINCDCEYATLVQDAALRDRFLAQINEEFERRGCWNASTAGHSPTVVPTSTPACVCGVSRSGCCTANRLRCCANGAGCIGAATPKARPRSCPACC